MTIAQTSAPALTDMPRITETAHLTPAQLASLASAAVAAASKSEPSEVIKGVQLRFEGGTSPRATALATDRHRVARVRLPLTAGSVTVDAGEPTWQALLPAIELAKAAKSALDAHKAIGWLASPPLRLDLSVWLDGVALPHAVTITDEVTGSVVRLAGIRGSFPFADRLFPDEATVSDPPSFETALLDLAFVADASKLRAPDDFPKPGSDVTKWRMSATRIDNPAKQRYAPLYLSRKTGGATLDYLIQPRLDLSR